MKPANWLQSFWILFRSLSYTGAFSAHILVKTSLFGSNRNYLDAAIRKWSARVLKFIRLSYKVYNPHHVQFQPHECYIVMSNHLSLYDIPLLFLSIPGSLRMIAKRELKRIPIFGHAMQVGEFIFVDRHNHSRAINDLEFAKEKMSSGIVPWIAPEGTRSRTGKLLPFKKGGFMLALQTGAKIVPVGIRGIEEVLPARSLRVMLDGHAEVHIGKTIDASKYSLKQRKRLIKDVRAAICEAAGLCSCPE